MDKLFPFTNQSWEIIDDLIVMFCGVVFKEAFGCFDKGEKIDYLTADFGKAMLTVYDEAGEKILEQPFCCHNYWSRKKV